MTRWFVVKTLQLGVTTRAGSADPAAWKDYGFDLDARTTTADDSKNSTNSCKRRSGSSTKMLMDGNDGIDNNFGQHIMSVIRSLRADVEDATVASIRKGSTTLLLRIDNFTIGDNDEAPGFVYLAGDFDRGASVPTFDADEKGWAIDSRSLTDGKTLAAPRATFPGGYVKRGHWVSGPFGAEAVELLVPMMGVVVPLALQGAFITFKALDGSDGTIAGVSDGVKLQQAMIPLFGHIGVCPGNPTYDQVVDTLTQSADLVTGAPNFQDVARECNAISIGLGFTLAKAGDHATAPIVALKSPADDCGVP